MNLYRNTVARLLIAAFVAMSASCPCAFGQNSNYNPSNLTSSPYTRYGLGRLGSVGNASTQSMGDLGVALRTNNFTNLYNPAALTAIDTLTMLFDTAIDAQMFTQKENGSVYSDWNAGFAYLSFHFPLWNRWAGAISYSPYSVVGYEYGNTTEESVSDEFVSDATQERSSSYSGNGGLQKFQLSVGWMPVKAKMQELSLGANFGYICGSVSYAGSETFSSGANNSDFTREFSVHGFDATFGAQYTKRFSATRSMTFGATYSPRTPLSTHTEVLKKSTSDANDTIYGKFTMDVPVKAGVGLQYVVNDKLMLGAEYTFENWDKVAGIDDNMSKHDGIYRSVNRVALGLDYRPQMYAQSYFKTCHYRMGMNVKNSYVETYGSQNNEYTLSCGIGMPVRKRCLFNLGLSYTRVQPTKSGLISENYLHVTFGITYNEIMFFRDRLR